MSAVQTKVRDLADNLTRDEWDLLWSLSATHNADGLPPTLQEKLRSSADALTAEERDEVRLFGDADVEGFGLDDDRPGLQVLAGLLTQYF